VSDAVLVVIPVNDRSRVNPTQHWPRSPVDVDRDAVRQRRTVRQTIRFSDAVDRRHSSISVRVVKTLPHRTATSYQNNVQTHSNTFPPKCVFICSKTYLLSPICSPLLTTSCLNVLTETRTMYWNRIYQPNVNVVIV